MEDIIRFLKQEIPNSDITYVVEGAKMKLSITAEMFSGMTRLDRQRYVKKLLTPWIHSGELHAVVLQIKGREENVS